MVEIVHHLHQYVPAVEYEDKVTIHSTGEVVTVQKANFSSVLLGGDQLTAAQVRSAIKAKVNEDTPADRFEGIVPVAEDRHTKME